MKFWCHIVMLRDTLKLLQERKIISLRDLSLHFDVDRDAMESMMMRLEEKGYVRKFDLFCSSCSTKKCSTCTSSLIDNVQYQLVEQ